MSAVKIDIPEQHAWIMDTTQPDEEPRDGAPTALELLSKAAGHMQARAATYDRPDGERSMGATVTAFNAVTGLSLTEAQGWLMMSILKMVRDNQRPSAHVDSCEDLVAYASLYGEARLR